MQYIVSVPLDPGLAEFIGKKGSEDSITFYNRKAGSDVIVALAPTFEDRFYAAAESMLISSQIVISTAVLDKLFGEVLLGASLIDRHVLLTNDNNIDQYLKGITLKDYEIIERSQVLDRIASFKPKYDSTSPTRIDIDKSFPVKGLGTVALGIVTSGTVRQHDELFHSSGKKALVRSIQSQDVDITEAGPGTRVGLALKGVEHGDIEKGDLLTAREHAKKTKSRIKITMNTAFPEKIEAGRYYDFISNFTYSRGIVEDQAGDELDVKFDRNTAVLPGDECLLMRDRAPRIFAHGKIIN